MKAENKAQSFEASLIKAQEELKNVVENLGGENTELKKEVSSLRKEVADNNTRMEKWVGDMEYLEEVFEQARLFQQQGNNSAVSRSLELIFNNVSELKVGLKGDKPEIERAKTEEQ